MNPAGLSGVYLWQPDNPTTWASRKKAIAVERHHAIGPLAGDRGVFLRRFRPGTADIPGNTGSTPYNFRQKK